MKEIKNKLHQLEIDAGTEFETIIQYCHKSDIIVIVYNGDKNSMSIVERFNRTLRKIIAKTCKDGIWVHKLKKLITAYNNLEHSGTGFTPNYLDEHQKIQKLIRDNLIWDSIPAKLELNKFKVGDLVRVYEKKKVFGKGQGTFSQKLHKVTEIRGNSLFLDDVDDKKYRYFNVMKVDKSVPNPNKTDEQIEAQSKIKSKAITQHKSARALHKDLAETGEKIKETKKRIQTIIDAPREPRIRKKTDVLNFKSF
jgi:hypothetical protein